MILGQWSIGGHVLDTFPPAARVNFVGIRTVRQRKKHLL
jgi:hypothetical protein